MEDGDGDGRSWNRELWGSGWVGEEDGEVGKDVEDGIGVMDMIPMHRTECAE